ncbi:SRPBCC domain-containing protein [Paenibacillus sp. KS-LC4]|uniref:SRPBCC family protein n=1 Tax=Paenibacillus sp. KS-LC4 TaxID=2979727 RepID=UPI0030CCFD4B
MTEQLEITRELHAPRELVFKVWSEVEHLKKWWGPTGLEISYAKLDFRPGGMFHYKMTAPDGAEMWGRFVFVEIVEPEKMVFVNSFSDKDGNAVRPPFSEIFPIEISNTLTFTEQDGKTILTLRGGPINATEAEQQFFIGMFDSMRQGFGGTFDQLEAYLKVVQVG